MNTQIFEEAAEWLIEFRTDDADLSTRRKFQAWLDKSPEHVCAYLKLTTVWEDSASLDRSKEIDIDSLTGLSRAESNVVAIDAASAVVTKKPFNKWWSMAACALLFLGVAAGAGYWARFYRDTWSTDVGQQRILNLPDGTTVELNADTRIREHFTAAQRRVELLQGQALFRVAKDPTRPFTVFSEQITVRALGTEFDVRLGNAGATVTVLEGSVAVLSAASVAPRNKEGRPLPAAVLGAGEQAMVVPGVVPARKRANTAVATAWTNQKLIFESVSLQEAAEEFNRFNARKLIVDPEGLENFRINGTFPALDPASLDRFLSFLREQPGLSLVEEKRRVHVAKNR